MRSLRCAFATVLIVPALAPAVTSAGPITPPPGPVGSTYKTLAEVEPRRAVNAANTPGSATSEFVISQAGSYYLTANIQVGPGKSGISIVTPGVTLDLNGFSIIGTAGSVDGVRIIIGCQAVTVRNGVIRGCGGDGLETDDLFTDGGMIEDLTVLHCGGNGIVSGLRSTVRRCNVFSNVGDGIVARFATRVSECSATNHDGRGIVLESVSTAEACTAMLNTGWGITGADDVRVERCHLNANNGGGVMVGNFSAVRNNTIDFHLNNLAAIRLTGHQNTAEGNAISRASIGVDVEGSANTVLRNTFSGTATPGDIAPANAFGPFVNITGAGDIAGIPGAGHPWANFVQ